MSSPALLRPLRRTPIFPSARSHARGLTWRERLAVCDQLHARALRRQIHSTGHDGVSRGPAETLGGMDHGRAGEVRERKGGVAGGRREELGGLSSAIRNSSEGLPNLSEGGNLGQARIGRLYSPGATLPATLRVKLVPSTKLAPLLSPTKAYEIPQTYEQCINHFKQLRGIGQVHAHRWHAEGCRTLSDVVRNGVRACSVNLTPHQWKTIFSFARVQLVREVERGFGEAGDRYEGWLYGFAEDSLRHCIRLELSHPDFDDDVPDELLLDDTTPLLRRMIDQLKRKEHLAVDQHWVAEGGRFWQGSVAMRGEKALGLDVQFQIVPWESFDKSER